MANIPFITAENAADLGRASQAAQKAKKELLAAEKLNPAAESEDAEKRRKLRLLRIRKQQDRIDEMLLSEDDAGKLDRLASAAIRLNEQERQLSNRSLPPTLKASEVKPRRAKASDPEPE